MTGSGAAPTRRDRGRGVEDVDAPQIAELPRPVPWRRGGQAWAVLPLQTWLALSHLLVLALPMLVVLGTGALASDLRNQTRWDLEHQGAILALHAAERVRTARQGDPGAGLAAIADALSATLRQTKGATLAGIRATDADGIVVATSGSTIGEDLSGDPEVAVALAGQPGVVVRPRPDPKALSLASESRRARVRLFVAVPVVVDGEVLGALVLSRTPREELQALYHMAPDGLLWGAAGALAFTLLVALVAGWVLTRSLKLLARGADQVADGGFDGLALLEDPSGSHVAEVASVSAAVTTMATRLRERLGYIAEFASNVSHEFKTPLSTLRGTVELLGDDDDMPAEQRARFLANATGEIDRLERLVSGLLALARAEERTGRRAVDLGQIATIVAARHPGVRLVPWDPAPTVRGSPDQLEVLLENLVANACRHAADGVELRVVPEGFQVEDDGPGISEANLPRVFDRFFTTDRAGGGTGLGLALVRAIAEGHGGRVTVDSRPGRTVFTVSLAPESAKDQPRSAS